MVNWLDSDYNTVLKVWEKYVFNFRIKTDRVTTRQFVLQLFVPVSKMSTPLPNFFPELFSKPGRNRTYFVYTTVLQCLDNTG